MRRDAAADERGAALLEAVVALAAVAVLVAGGADLHRAIVAARLASEGTVAALATATATAELARAVALDAETVTGVSEELTTLWRRRDCDDGATSLREVPVRPGTTADAVGVLRVVAPTVTDAVVVSVRTGTGDPVPGAVVDVTAADGTRSARTADSDGCVDLGPSPGPVRIAVTTAAGATGGTVVPGDHAVRGRHAGPAAPLPVTVSGAGRVTVVVATEGALPDRIDDGRLAWWRGDATGAPTAAPGEALVLPEGRHAVVVGTCADPRAGGSATAVIVAAGGDEVVTVSLGHVVVARPDVADGRRLVLRRQRPCPSTSVRPALSWDVGGGGGRLAAAVPDGAWEAVLEDAAGSRLKGPVSVRVAGAAEVVPPW